MATVTRTSNILGIGSILVADEPSGGHRSEPPSRRHLPIDGGQGDGQARYVRKDRVRPRPEYVREVVARTLIDGDAEDFHAGPARLADRHAGILDREAPLV